QITTRVGDTIQFQLAPQVNLSAESVGPFNNVNAHAAGCVNLGIAFGASAVNPAVTLSSQRLGGAFPAASQANAANAAANALVAFGTCAVTVPTCGNNLKE